MVFGRNMVNLRNVLAGLYGDKEEARRIVREVGLKAAFISIGDKPINTSGGLKCKGHPVGATGVSQVHEIWKQLRQEAGPRQVPIKDLRIGATHNLGGTPDGCAIFVGIVGLEGV